MAKTLTLRVQDYFWFYQLEAQEVLFPLKLVTALLE